ncbi:MAG: hypothetical protein KAG92_04885, partial [Deltaproteobacteria bacterium]|nr:hypothetical protein [Deltaproteobacteria bacterium]
MLKIPTDWGDRASLRCFKLASTVFNLLPAADAYKLGHQLIRLWLTFDRKHQRVIEKNLEIALQLEPKSPASMKLQTEISQNLGSTLCEFFLLQNPACRRLLQQNLQITGLEHLNQAQADKSGAIIVSAHFGNWELAGFLSTLMRKPITTVAKPIKGKPHLYAAIERTRREVGFVPLD